jgi:hypothetical protein
MTASRPRRARLVRELPAVRREVAWWHRHPLGNGPPHVSHEAPEVAPAHVALHDHEALAALVLDDLRSFTVRRRATCERVTVPPAGVRISVWPTASGVER